MTSQTATETLEYILLHLKELDRAERHWNRDNPGAVLHAQICINNVKNALKGVM